MSDTNISVDIFNPQGLYPSRTVICENIAYLISAGIPMLVSESQDASKIWWERGKYSELLYGALLLTRKSFPCFSFHPHPVATIHFKGTNISEAIIQTVGIISSKRELPCLYDPYSGKGEPSNPAAYIKRLRSLDTYIDLFHAPQIPFSDLVAELCTQYKISQQRFRPEFVTGLYRKLNSSSRLIHIAVHYFVNATRLIHEHFIGARGFHDAAGTEHCFVNRVGGYHAHEDNVALTGDIGG